MWPFSNPLDDAPYWEVGMLDVGYYQGDLIQHYDKYYTAELFGEGMCFAVCKTLQEKILSNSTKNILIKTLVENYVNRIKSSASPIDFILRKKEILTSTPQDRYKTKKSILRIYVNQALQSRAGGNKNFDEKLFTKELLTKEINENGVVRIHLRGDSVAHALLIIRDNEEGKVRVFDPNFGLSKGMSIDQAISQINLIKVFYKFHIQNISLDNKTSIEELNVSTQGEKVHRVKPYHLLQIMLGEITVPDPNLNVRRIYHELGKELIEHIVEKYLSNPVFSKINPPLKREEAIARLIKFGFRKKEVIGADFKEEGRGWKGQNDLHDAICAKKGELSDELVRKFANEPDYDFEYPIHTAAKFGNANAVWKLLQFSKAFVSELDVNRETPLHFAADRGDSGIAKILIDNGANVNAESKTGWTPLHYSVLSRNKILVELLLKHKADPNSPDFSGYTPFHLAAERESADIVMMLLEHGANLESKTENGQTPLFRAVVRDNLEMVKLLVSLKANIDDRSHYGITALSQAAWTGNLDIVQFLISSGANINIVSDVGNTALIHAAQNGGLDVVKELLKHDVEVHVKNNDGKTALDLAKTEEIKKLIEGYIKAKAEQARLLGTTAYNSTQAPTEKQSTIVAPQQGLRDSLISIAGDVYKNVLATITDGAREMDSNDTGKKPDDRSK